MASPICVKKLTYFLQIYTNSKQFLQIPYDYNFQTDLGCASGHAQLLVFCCKLSKIDFNLLFQADKIYCKNFSNSSYSKIY